MAKRFLYDPESSLLTGLVSNLKLGSLLDYYGSNDLTNYSNVEFVPGKIDDCASFNGSNYLRRANPISTQITNVSMFIWVYISGTSTRGCFFKNGEDSQALAHGGSTDGYAIGVGGTQMDNVGNNLIGLCEDVAWLNFNTAIGTGWHFVGMKRGTTTWRGYIDGVVCATTFTSTPKTPTTEMIFGAADPLNPDLGDPVARRMFTGKLNEFLFYNREVTDAEIGYLYNGGDGNPMYDDADENSLTGAVTESGETVGKHYWVSPSIPYINDATLLTGRLAQTAITESGEIVGGNILSGRKISGAIVESGEATIGYVQRSPFRELAHFMTDENVNSPSKITADTSDSNAIFME